MKGSNLSYEDPWSTAPAVQAEPAPVSDNPVSADAVTAAAVVKPVVVTATNNTPDGKMTLTFKGAGGYGDRWIVAHVANPAEGLSLLNDPAFKELLELSKRIAAWDGAPQGGAPQQAAANGGGQQQQSRAPQPAQEAPGGEKRFCSHGEMEFKSGVSKKSGKPYKLFSCTAPRDQQCEAQFLK